MKQISETAQYEFLKLCFTQTTIKGICLPTFDKIPTMHVEVLFMVIF